jgi:DNA polymerase III subunit delta'
MKFSDIIGQEVVKEKLLNSVRSSRVSHAQLFFGPEGAGALALAVAYAQYICCIQKEQADSCGHCVSCRKYEKLVHPDLHLAYPVATVREIKEPKSVDFIADFRTAFLNNPYLSLEQWYQAFGMENKQGQLLVAESSDILRKLSLKTVESEYKIVIIWMPEKMRMDASIKLLKIIEEPPPKSLFILVSENVEQLISTICSRVQMTQISRLPDNTLIDVLVRQHELNVKEATSVAHLAEGNYNLAVGLLHTDHSVESPVNAFLEWMRLCLKLKVQDLVVWVETISKTGRERQKNFLSYCIQLLRESLLLSLDAESLIKLDGSDLNSLKKFAPFVHKNNIHQFIEEFNKAHYHIVRNVNAKLVFMDLSMQINSLLKIKA